MTLFSVIIATHDRNQQLGECLEALSKVRSTGFEFEVIIVDDGSPAPASLVADEYDSSLRLRVIRQENAGPSRARNRGAKVAEGKLLVFTDDDCMPHPAWLEQYRLGFERWGDCLLGGGVDLADKQELCGLASHLLGYQRFERYAKDPRQALNLATLNLAVPKESFLAMGGFDESFPLAAYEDRDFCVRWASSGRIVRFASEARVVHNHRMGMAEFLRQHIRFGRGAKTYYQRNGRSARQRITSGLLADYAEVMRGVSAAASGFDRVRLLGLLGLSQVAASYGYLTAGIRRPAPERRWDRSMVTRRRDAPPVEEHR